MKKWFFLLWLAPSLLLAQTNGMTLAETRDAVLLGNPSVREALQRIIAAEAVLKQARSAYLPTVTLSGGYGRVDTSLHPDAYPDLRASDSYTQASGTLQANWLLFDGFAREARSLSAKYGVRQSREAADNTRRLLILSATVSFRQAQQARQNIDIAEQDFAFNKKLEDDAKRKFEAGMLPEADVQNFSINALQADSSALQARLNYKTACAVLAELMAYPEAQLPESMQPVAIAFDLTGPVPRFDTELSYALDNRPDYQAVQSGLLALEQQVRAAKGDMMPKIALAGEVNYNDKTDYVDTDQHGGYDSFFGVTASWDLFAGGRKLNTVREAEAQRGALEEQREALRLSIRSSLRQRIDEAETARLIYQRQEQIYALSESVRNSVEKSYKVGLVSITRLNEAQTGLVAARAACSGAYINYQLVLNQLDVETGRVLYTFGE